MTFDELQDDAPAESPMKKTPIELLRLGIETLEKAGRAQVIVTQDGEGVRFFQAPRS